MACSLGFENNDVVIVVRRWWSGCHIWNLATEKSSHDIEDDDEDVDELDEEDNTGMPSGS